jgi:hypothetical protein
VARTSGTNANLAGAAYGVGGYVAVGAEGTILTSVDGVEWAKRASGTEVGSVDLKGVAHGAKGHVAVGENGKTVASADGVLWKPSVAGTGSDLWAVTTCSGHYVATGSLNFPAPSGRILRRVYLSADGEKWSAMGMAERSSYYGVACGGDRTVVLVGKTIVQSDPLPEAK